MQAVLRDLHDHGLRPRRSSSTTGCTTCSRSRYPRAHCSIRGSRRRCRTGSTFTPGSSTARAARSGRRRRSSSMAAGYGTSPCSSSRGSTRPGDYFQFVELLFGGLPGRPLGDGLDGHSWWPLFRTTPAEYAEGYYPVVIERYVPVRDSGGAGLPPRRHRDREGLPSSPAPGEFTVQRRPRADRALGDQRRPRTAAAARRR